jgi:hypothetical protein
MKMMHGINEHMLGTGTYTKRRADDRTRWHDYFSFSSIVCEGIVLFLLNHSHTLSFLYDTARNKSFIWLEKRRRACLLRGWGRSLESGSFDA